MPYDRILDKSLSWGTVSNALKKKSTVLTSVYIPLSTWLDKKLAKLILWLTVFILKFTISLSIWKLVIIIMNNFYLIFPSLHLFFLLWHYNHQIYFSIFLLLNIICSFLNIIWRPPSLSIDILSDPMATQAKDNGSRGVSKWVAVCVTLFFKQMLHWKCFVLAFLIFEYLY